eukprot:1844839-Pyramimonas_sp.AAC.1
MPAAWMSQKPRLQHADKLGIYTDGSCMDVANEDDEKEARTGVRVYSERTSYNQRLSFRTKRWTHNLVKLVGGTYTDSLVSLHLLNKTRLQPFVIWAGHKHGRTLRMILLKAGMKARFGSSTYAMHVHFYKVPAHSGIEGNEIADELAN